MISQQNSRPSATSALSNQQQVNPNSCQAKPPNLILNPQVRPQMGMLNPQASNHFNGPNIPMQKQSGAPNAQQVNPNSCQANPPNLIPNPQVQPQMGMLNPQDSNHFNRPNIPMQQQNGAPNAQQVPPNFHGNQPNLISNSQIQSQMGMLNPQMPMLFNNFNTPMFNGLVPMLVNPQNGFMMQMNPNQPFNQFFAPNCMSNFPMYQNSGFPMQNMNQFVQRPLSNFNQAGPCNVPVYPNQIPQVMGPQNPNFNPNTQFGMVPNNVPMQPNGQTQPNLVNNAAQLPQGNTMVQPNIQLAPPQQAQNGVRPHVSNIPQGNYVNNNGMTSPQGKWKNHQNRNFTNTKGDGLQKGFQKNNNMQNGKGTVRSHLKHEVKGYQGQAGQKPNFANSLNHTPVQSKKKLSLNYTMQEIQQWREERKKNFPSEANLEKKQEENMTRSEENDRTAKLRRQQLKDILEKQAKIGCEVAEIPSHYLYDSEKQPNEKEENTRAFGKREKFQKNKFNKRGRSRQSDRFAKKQKFGENESPNIHTQNELLPLNKREPTLLRKLLSADIRRDKASLLQVFRFMVMNSFLKDWPKTPLSFPLVMVKEAGAESKVVEQKSVLENGVFETKDRIALEEPNSINGDDSGDDDENDNVDNRSSDALDDRAARLSILNCIVEGEDEGKEEEEGEIVY